MNSNPFASASELLALQLAQYLRLQDHVDQLESLCADLTQGDGEPFHWNCGSFPVEQVLLFATINRQLLRMKLYLNSDERQSLSKLHHDSESLIDRWQRAVAGLGECAKAWLAPGLVRDQ